MSARLPASTSTEVSYKDPKYKKKSKTVCVCMNCHFTEVNYADTWNTISGLYEHNIPDTDTPCIAKEDKRKSNYYEIGSDDTHVFYLSYIRRA